MLIPPMLFAVLEAIAAALVAVVPMAIVLDSIFMAGYCSKIAQSLLSIAVKALLYLNQSFQLCSEWTIAPASMTDQSGRIV